MKTLFLLLALIPSLVLGADINLSSIPVAASVKLTDQLLAVTNGTTSRLVSLQKVQDLLVTTVSVASSQRNLADWHVSVDESGVYAALSDSGKTYWQSNDLSALLQRCDDASGDATRYNFTTVAKPNPGSNIWFMFVFTNTVIFRHASVLVGAGDPTTIFRPADGGTVPLMQFGTASNFISGIVRIEKIRFQGNYSTSGQCSGVRFFDTAEPSIMDCEFALFPFAGAWFSSPGFNHWSFIQNSWFWSPALTNSSGVLIDCAPTSAAEMYMDNNQFFSDGGRCITVSNNFTGIAVRNNRFRTDSSAVVAVDIYAGRNFNFSGNTFIWGSIPPIVFRPLASPTAVNALVSGNVTIFGSSFASVGSNVNGVVVTGNEGNGQVAYSGSGSGLTNLTVYGSNIVSGGVLPNGLLSTNSPVNGGFLQETGDKRKLTFDGGSLTNLTGGKITGPITNLSNTTLGSAGQTIINASGNYTSSGSLLAVGGLSGTGGAITNGVLINTAGTHYLTNDANGFGLDSAPMPSYSMYSGGAFAVGRIQQQQTTANTFFRSLILGSPTYTSGNPLLYVTPVNAQTVPAFAVDQTNGTRSFTISATNGQVDAYGPVFSTNGISSLSSNLLAIATITVGASPFSWTNTFTKNVYVFVDGGTGTALAINGTTVFTSLTGGHTIPLQPKEYVTSTHTVAPTMFWKPF